MGNGSIFSNGFLFSNPTEFYNPKKERKFLLANLKQNVCNLVFEIWNLFATNDFIRSWYL